MNFNMFDLQWVIQFNNNHRLLGKLIWAFGRLSFQEVEELTNAVSFGMLNVSFQECKCIHINVPVSRAIEQLILITKK